MLDNLIGNYIENLTLQDVMALGKNNGIDTSKEDASYVLNSVKKNWYTLYKGDPTSILNDIKNHIDIDTYQQLEKLYYDFKNKYHF